MTTITPEILDKVDRFHAESINQIKAMDLPVELSVNMRQGLSRFLDKTLQESMQATGASINGTNTNTTALEF